MRENSLKNNAPTLKNKSRICLIAMTLTIRNLAVQCFLGWLSTWFQNWEKLKTLAEIKGKV
jgi:hypothetical protein